MQLAHEVLSGAAPARQSLLVLHGILGRGSNLRTLAKQFLEARPDWQAVLVDLRAHGDSLGDDGQPDTLAQAALDVAGLAATLAAPARAVVGHSFGGKVALALPQSLAGLAHTMALDSAPGVRPGGRGSEDVIDVIQMLEAMHGPWHRRDDFVREVQAQHKTRFLAQWLAMNLVLRDGAFHFGPSLPRVRALLASYFELDLWPALEAASATGPAFHLVIGLRSGVYDDDERRRAHAVADASAGRVTVDALPTGHWVHAEDAAGTLRVLLARVP